MSDIAFETLLAAMLAIAWIVELATARSMSPSLRLIANPAIARFGWRFALVGAIMPFLPFYNPILGVVLLGPNLLIAANNLERLWLARSLGETRLMNMLEEAARTRRLGLAVASFLGSGLMVSLFGGVLMLFSSQGQGDWSYWFGVGLIFYGIGAALMRIAFTVKLHRRSA